MTIIFITLFLLLSPFYFFESGGIQPSHAFFLILFFYYFIFEKKFKMNISPSNYKALKIFSVFIIYIFTINIIASIFNGGTLPIKYSFYYMFNFMIFLFFLDFFSHAEGNAIKIFYLLGVTLLIQLILMLNGSGRTWNGHQPIIFFNNPNQLGYFSLLASSTLVLIGALKKKEPLLVLGMICMATYLAVAAVSITASIGIIVGGGIYYLSKIKQRTKLFYLITIATITISVFFGEKIYNSFTSGNIYTRIDNKFSQKTVRDGGWVAGRGYDTLLKEPKYLLFGMGELPGRFHNEFHSTFGNILRSYGFVGLSILLLFGYFVFKGRPLFTLYYFIPILIYGISHNGIRQPLLWIFLACVLSLSKQHESE